MSATRVSTDAQDLTAQRDALAALDVAAERVYVDHVAGSLDGLLDFNHPHPRPLYLNPSTGEPLR